MSPNVTVAIFQSLNLITLRPRSAEKSKCIVNDTNSLKIMLYAIHSSCLVVMLHLGLRFYCTLLSHVSRM